MRGYQLKENYGFEEGRLETKLHIFRSPNFDDLHRKPFSSYHDADNYLVHQGHHFDELGE